MVAKQNRYVDLQGRVLALAELDKAERAAVEKLQALAETHPEWSAYRNGWLSEVQRLYAPRGLSRSQMTETVVYRVGQDLGSRLAFGQGKARRSDYRDELEQLILTRFQTRRAFCEATGLSEDMLSHVLARRKHLAIDTLTTALERVGYTLHIGPLEGPRV
jgi:hypothetical protein